MNDQDKTKEQLIGELAGFRQEVAELEAEKDLFQERHVASRSISGITKRKHVEKALQESEQRFRSVFEYAAIGMVVAGLDGRFRQVNRAMCDIVGYPEEALLCKTFHEITHPNDLGADLENVRRMLEGAIPSFQMEKRYLHKDGHIVWVLLNASVVRDSGGNPMYFIGQIQDITDRKKAEEALRESEAMLRSTFRAAPVGIGMVADRILCWANDRLCRMTGYASDEMVGRNARMLYPTAEYYAYVGSEKYRQIRARGSGTVEARWRRKDGREIDVLLSSTSLDPDDLSRGVVFTALDITERKQMEQELVRLERLRALGEMSAGVSHNLNNILTSVLGPAQMLQMVTDDPAVLQEADTIIESTLRARDLVHRLHLSTRGLEEDTLQPVQVNEIVLEAIRAARFRWKDEPEAKGISIEVVTDLEEVSPIQGTESRLHDIFMNLLFNAVDAMPEGGKITIRTQAVAEGVQITVSDTGIGMDEETGRRVFEPFFTTKMDVGSGLGLSTAYGAVTRWGGAIDLESEPGRGTRFTIRLPVWTKPTAQEERTVEVRQVRPGKLLIVEADETVCKVLSRLLGRHHEVAVVQDGKKALEMFAPGCYDVALIDLGMPGAPGDQVFREMRQADPSLVSVLITGCELLSSDPRLSLFDFRMPKPFEDMGKLMDVIAQAVELHAERVKQKA